MTSTLPLQNALDQLQTLAREIKAKPDVIAALNNGGNNTPQFTDILNRAITEVNRAQEEGDKLTERFTIGGKNAPALEEVVMSLQRASLSFQEMVQVRNRLVTAYNEIMTMQI